RPGTYPLAPNATITRSHFSVEGLSNPILDEGGYLNRFANPVKVVAADLGDQSLWVNVLILVRANDVAVTGLSFVSTAEGLSTDVNTLVNLYPIAFEGQWFGPQDINFVPRGLIGGSIRLCEFDGWLMASGFNYASGTVEQCKVEHCFVGFYTGPAPGGAHLKFKQNLFNSNFEASLQACGAPQFWSAPVQPASLV